MVGPLVCIIICTLFYLFVFHVIVFYIVGNIHNRSYQLFRTWLQKEDVYLPVS